LAEKITIDFELDGKVKIEGDGFADGSCTELTRQIEEALGEVEARELKPEYERARSKGRAVSR
jgi:hypothetical protein